MNSGDLTVKERILLRTGIRLLEKFMVSLASRSGCRIEIKVKLACEPKGLPEFTSNWAEQLDPAQFKPE